MLSYDVFWVKWRDKFVWLWWGYVGGLVKCLVFILIYIFFCSCFWCNGLFLLINLLFLVFCNKRIGVFMLLKIDELRI